MIKLNYNKKKTSWLRQIYKGLRFSSSFNSLPALEHFPNSGAMESLLAKSDVIVEIETEPTKITAAFLFNLWLR